MKKIINNSILICSVIALFQAFSLASYTTAAFIGAIVTRDIERIDTFVTENIIYVLLILIIALVAKSFRVLKKYAYTPFLLIQLFGLIIAWPLMQGEMLSIKIFGFLLGLVSIVGIILALIPLNRKKFI
jgi:hypothetical protein